MMSQNLLTTIQVLLSNILIGGSNILEDYSGYDITEAFHNSSIHRHSRY